MKKEMEDCGREWITDSPGLASITSMWDNLLQEGNGLFDLMSFSSWISTVWRINMREIKASGADSHFHLRVFLSQQTLMETGVFTWSAWWRGWLSKGYRLPRCRAQQQQPQPGCSCRRRPPGCSSRICHSGARPGSAGPSQLSQHPCWTRCWTARTQDRGRAQQCSRARSLLGEKAASPTLPNLIYTGWDCSGFGAWPGGEAQFWHTGCKWGLSELLKIRLASPLIPAFPLPSQITQSKADISTTWKPAFQIPHAQKFSCTITWILDSFVSIPLYHNHSPTPSPALLIKAEIQWHLRFGETFSPKTFDWFLN